MIVQKSFGDFIRDTVGPNWVYAASNNPKEHARLAARYAKGEAPAIVIKPAQQKQLATDYKAAWGREHDPEHWAMLCALRVIHDLAKHRDNAPALVEATAAAAIEFTTGRRP